MECHEVEQEGEGLLLTSQLIWELCVCAISLIPVLDVAD